MVEPSLNECIDFDQSDLSTFVNKKIVTSTEALPKNTVLDKVSPAVLED